MHDGFEGWVRVQCCGPLAYAAMTAAAIPNIPLPQWLTRPTPGTLLHPR